MAYQKIAIFSHTHPSVTRGGAEISAYTLYQGLRDLGLDVVFIAACPTRDKNKLLLASEDEYAVFYEPQEYDAYYHVAPPAIVERVEEIVREAGVEVAIFHHLLFFGANSIRRLADNGLEVALTLHEFLILCHNHGQMVTNPAQKLCSRSHPVACGQCFPALEPTQFAARQRFLLDSLGGVVSFISPSRFLMERFIEWGFPADRFHFVENGLNGETGTSAVSPAPAAMIAARSAVPARHAEGEDEDQSTAIIGFFGQLNPFKGVDVILDAAERLREEPGPRRAQFRIHGTIVSLPEASQVRLDAAISARMLEYVGPYDNADVHTLMGQCDFILMASRWWENSPVVIQEAFAAQRPLIVPGIGGMAEKVIEGVNGFHFKPSDSIDLARVIRRAVTCDTSSFAYPRPSTRSEMAKAYLQTLPSFAGQAVAAPVATAVVAKTAPAASPHL